LLIIDLCLKQFSILLSRYLEIRSNSENFHRAWEPGETRIPRKTNYLPECGSIMG